MVGFLDDHGRRGKDCLPKTAPLLEDFWVREIEREREKPGEREEKRERFTVLEGLRKYAANHVLLKGREEIKQEAQEKIQAISVQNSKTNDHQPSIFVILKIGEGFSEGKAMTLNPTIMSSVEQLGYRVSVGDVASQAGLEINLAQKGLLTLASEAGGHLQVADTGEIIYLFPENFRSILRNKYWKLRLQEWWGKTWQVLFYLIRISFGIILILSIILMLIAITVIVIAITSSRDGEGNNSSSNRDSGGGGIIFLPNFWISPDIFWFFTPDYNQSRHQRKTKKQRENELNFLEAIFSFLFGDGAPNANLEDRRWQEIGTVIRNNRGAVIAQQIAPYLDDINKSNSDDEDYMLPVLTRFNGYPEVSPAGGLIYYFPELQVTAKQRQKKAIEPYLREELWKFTAAGSGQKMLAIGLGGLNFILALVLGSLLTPEVTEQLGGLIAFVSSIYWLLLGYATGYLAIPLIRYFWIQGRNQKIEFRNQKRQERARLLTYLDSDLEKKINYAHQFADEKVITEKDITYSTEKDLLDQQIEQADKIDAEWQKRLEQS
jgi:flagellar basal body-associated protein FliL